VGQFGLSAAAFEELADLASEGFEHDQKVSIEGPGLGAEEFDDTGGFATEFDGERESGSQSTCEGGVETGEIVVLGNVL
jgi:hypothetical protein